MNEFTASNGVTIRYTVGIDGAKRLIGTSPRPSGDEWTEATASPEGIEALREFFRAEEDKRLGRWGVVKRARMVLFMTALVMVPFGLTSFNGASLIGCAAVIGYIVLTIAGAPNHNEQEQL
ncbi:hypothetical protein F6X37_32465 [Paraburkholderia sp. 31.1]|uniref:hypothetical protein n=1 Tax=Paraburkholderia sp. 31.1 TaxID=2615205 RepID=UPI0016552D4C|nr:hypothetical protein [Paraburkholderia sp. 31.1]MBC8726083.1 hypothetical protein [Paraburkholderia sp. 31.1]